MEYTNKSIINIPIIHNIKTTDRWKIIIDYLVKITFSAQNPGSWHSNGCHLM